MMGVKEEMVAMVIEERVATIEPVQAVKMDWGQHLVSLLNLRIFQRAQVLSYAELEFDCYHCLS